MEHYVYVLTYPDGRVFYVGKGVRKRIYEHERQAGLDIPPRGANTHKIRVIRQIWATGGKVSKIKLAHFATHEEAIEYEIALIFFMDGLVNLTSGGDGRPGHEVSAETRRKLSESLRNAYSTEEARQKLRVAATNRRASEQARLKMSQTRRGRKAKPFSEEHRRNIGAARKGKPLSEEHRRKLSEAHKGKPSSRKNSAVTLETRQKLSAAKKGKSHSEEHRRKIGDAQRGRVMSIETRQKVSKTMKRRAQPFSEEHRRKLSEARRRRGPFRHSEETRRKMSESKKEKYRLTKGEL